MKPKTSKSIFLIFMLLLLIFSCKSVLPDCKTDYQFNTEDPIQFTVENPTEDFRILQLPDIQIFFPHEIDGVYTLIKKLVAKVKPHYIVFTGDQIQGLGSYAYLETIMPKINALNIPFSPVFGNHDIEGGSLQKQADLYKSLSNCRFKQSPASVHGVSNYVVNLVDKSNKPLYSLFLFDSNQIRVYSAVDKILNVLGGYNYDFIYPNQITWYQRNVEGIQAMNNGKVVPSFAFFHIPLPEFRLYTQAAPENILIPQKKKLEKVHNAIVNTGLFSKAKELNSTTGIFVGHDHLNNFVFKLDGIVLGYGLKCGHCSYHDPDLCGGTLITLKDRFTRFEVKHVYDSELD